MEEYGLKLIKDLGKWKNLKLLLMGKIALVKMSVLPKIMFYFQTIPIVKGEKIFDNWQRKTMNFIWSGKKPRVKLKIMVDDRTRGGLQVSNLQLYHDAVALTWIKDWMTVHNKKLLNLEGFNIRYGWHGYLCYDENKLDSSFLHHFIRNSLLTVWRKYNNRMGIERSGWISPLEVSDARFNPKAVLTYKDLVKLQERNVIIKSTEELPNEINWFQYYP